MNKKFNKKIQKKLNNLFLTDNVTYTVKDVLKIATGNIALLTIVFGIINLLIVLG